MDYFVLPQSSAIRIVDPKAAREEKRTLDNVQRQCRNFLLHGYCKNQDKGCIYLHPAATNGVDNTTQADSIVSNGSAPLNSLTSAAPEFVPKSLTSIAAVESTVAVPTSTTSSSTGSSFIPTPEAPAFVPKSIATELTAVASGQYNPYENGPTDGMDLDSLNNQMNNLDAQYYDAQYDPNVPYYHHHAGPVFIRQPLNYHLYTPTAPPAKVDPETHFFSRKVEFMNQLRSRSETIRGVPPAGANLPEEIQGYHTFVPLEPNLPPNERRKVANNWHTTAYRAINTNDGLAYCLVRVENYRLTKQEAFSHVEAWQKLRHPGIVSLHEAFTTRAFGDNSVVFVYEYHAEAKTLYDHHFKSTPPNSNTTGYTSHNKYNKHYHQIQRDMHGMTSSNVIPERIIWSYIVQLASALQTIHTAGRAAQLLDVSKVIVTGKNRVRLSTCGLTDVLMYDDPNHSSDMKYLQQMDLMLLGRLIFALLTNNTVNLANHAAFAKALDHITSNYSPQMKEVVVWLASKGNGHGIGFLLEQMPNQIAAEMDDALTSMDRMEHHLLSELENARLVRLLCKFGFINERPEFARDPRWSETGDRYILKLFRDYVFHQVDEHGQPVVSLSHVLTCLNKLDAASEERIMLVSRDEQSCLVVSYKEVKNCVESAFRELSNPPASTMPDMSAMSFMSHYRT